MSHLPELLKAISAIGWEAAALTFRILGLLSIPSVLVRRRGAPLAAISWILSLVGIPGIALPLWWLIGRRHLERKRRKRRFAAQRISPKLGKITQRMLQDRAAARDEILPLRHVPEEVEYSVFAPTPNNQAHLLVDASSAYPAMETAIKEARHHVHFLFYIWNDDETGRRFRDLLIEKAKEGVEVRALYDAFGSSKLGKRFLEPMRKAGVRVGAFLPVRLMAVSPVAHFRNHRKLLIVDGRVAFTGGINIGNEYLENWHDLMVTIHGPAVAQLQEVFADDWYFVTNEDLAEERFFHPWREEDRDESETVTIGVVASGPDTRINAMRDIFFTAINQAQERLYITTPYFVPDPAIRASLRSATYRGVDVRLLLPGQSDVPIVQMAARAYYPELLDLGARIFEYRPRVLHAKASIFDRDLALVGSANMDTRSFRLNFEASCLIKGEPFTGMLTKVFEEDLEQSDEIKPGDLSMTSWPKRVIESAAHLLSPLL